MITKTLKSLAILISTFSLVACQTFAPSTTQIERDGIDIISTSSDNKLAYIKTRGNQEVFCAPREGDIADTYSDGGGIGFSLVGKSESGNENNSKGALSLGGRNPEVLLARELLFRACELSSNTNADGATAVQIYTIFLEKMVELSRSTSGTGTSSKSASVSTPATQIKLPTFSNTNTKTTDDMNAKQDNSGNKSSGDNKKSCDPVADWGCRPDKK